MLKSTACCCQHDLVCPTYSQTLNPKLTLPTPEGPLKAPKFGPSLEEAVRKLPSEVKERGEVEMKGKGKVQCFASWAEASGVLWASR